MKHKLVNIDGVTMCTCCGKDSTTDGKFWTKPCRGKENPIHSGHRNKEARIKFFEEMFDERTKAKK